MQHYKPFIAFYGRYVEIMFIFLLWRAVSQATSIALLYFEKVTFLVHAPNNNESNFGGDRHI